MNARREKANPSRRKSSDELDEAFDKLEREAPDALTHVILWLRRPQARRVRIPVGVLCIIAGLLWFLPVVGIEFLPIGLLLIAQDVPFLRAPVGRMTLWLLDRWKRLRNWFRKRKACA
jgi:hypothetical protein